MFFFCCLGGAWPPDQTAKKKHAHAQTAKKITPEKPKQQKRPDNKKINTLTGVLVSMGPGRVLYFGLKYVPARGSEGCGWFV